jgi:hypothetical protein
MYTDRIIPVEILEGKTPGKFVSCTKVKFEEDWEIDEPSWNRLLDIILCSHFTGNAGEFFMYFTALYKER